MTSFADDLIALFDMIEKDAAELRLAQPEHPLLKFAAAVLQTESWSEELLAEFSTQFYPTGKEIAWRVWFAYWEALETALGREPKSKEPEPVVIARRDVVEDESPIPF